MAKRRKPIHDKINPPQESKRVFKGPKEASSEGSLPARKGRVSDEAGGPLPPSSNTGVVSCNPLILLENRSIHCDWLEVIFREESSNVVCMDTTNKNAHSDCDHDDKYILKDKNEGRDYCIMCKGYITRPQAKQDLQMATQKIADMLRVGKSDDLLIGTAQFDGIVQITEGIKLYVGLHDPEQPQWRKLEISGTGMRRLNHEFLWNHYDLFVELNKLDIIKISRFDFAVDYKGLALVPLCREHIRGSQAFVTRAKGFDRAGHWENSQLSRPETIYVGSVDSDSRLCIYDKRVETLKMRKFDLGFELTRWELRLKRDRATRLFNLIIKAGRDKWHIKGLELLFGYIDFKDFESCETMKHAKNAHTAKWWHVMMSKVAKNTLTGNVIKELDEKTWTQETSSNIGKRLIKMIEVHGVFKALDKIIASSKDKMTKKDLSQLAELKRQKNEHVEYHKAKDDIEFDDYYKLTTDELGFLENLPKEIREAHEQWMREKYKDFPL